MSFEALKAKILGALTLAEQAIRLSNIHGVESDPDRVKARRAEEDSHRQVAMGFLDTLLEKGIITPEEAERRKAKWDVMHGY